MRGMTLCRGGGERAVLALVLVAAALPVSQALRSALRRWRRRDVDVVVKFGGSAITTKTSFETVDERGPLVQRSADATTTST